jgi:hypothetical protein
VNSKDTPVSIHETFPLKDEKGEKQDIMYDMSVSISKNDRINVKVKK